MKVRPRGVDVAGEGINREVRLVVERAQSEGVGGKNYGADVLRAICRCIRRIRRRIRRHPDYAGVVAGSTGDAVFNTAVEVVAHKEQIAVPVPGHDRVAGRERTAGH